LPLVKASARGNVAICLHVEAPASLSSRPRTTAGAADQACPSMPDDLAGTLARVEAIAKARF
jgi:hypothetical protein